MSEPTTDQLIEGIGNYIKDFCKYPINRYLACVADRLAQLEADLKVSRGQNEGKNDIIKKLEAEKQALEEERDLFLCEAITIARLLKADELKQLTNENAAQQRKIERVEKEREVWKSQLTYISDKHRELHQLELEWEKIHPLHENYKYFDRYQGQKFSNDVICVWEIAVSEVKQLEPTPIPVADLDTEVSDD